MKAEVLKSFTEAGVSYSKGKKITIQDGPVGKDGKKHPINLRRFNSLRSQGKLKGSK